MIGNKFTLDHKKNLIRMINDGKTFSEAREKLGITNKQARDLYYHNKNQFPKKYPASLECFDCKKIWPIDYDHTEAIHKCPICSTNRVCFSCDKDFWEKRDQILMVKQ